MENVLNVKNRAEFRAWLFKNHDKASECLIEVRRGKPKDDGVFYYLDAVEEALCFGWIDSTNLKAGERRLQRFSPRRKNSSWTELNKERVRRLERLGLMTDAGRAVLPSMGPRSFRIDPEIEAALKQARCWSKFMAFPPLYRRIRAYNAAFFKKRDRAQYEKALAHLIEETRKGRMYGEWNDYGRLLENEEKMSLKLIKLTAEYKSALIEMLDEWRADQELNDTDRSPSAIFKNDPQDLAYYLDNLEQRTASGDRVPNSVFFLLDEKRNRLLGAVSIRHYLNEAMLQTCGHIGDGIRPSERRRGYATEMLRLALKECIKLGIDRVLLICDKANIGSAKAIIRNGGVLENEIVNESGAIMQRYWIDLKEKCETRANDMQQTNEFTPNENYPKSAPVPQRGDILPVLALFGINSANEIKLIDSTHDAADIRLNYVIDKKWVLRFCNPSSMSEKRISELNRLISRYIDFGLICPRFIADGAGKHLLPWENLVCYLSEYVDLELASDLKLEPEAEDALLREVQRSVAAFAKKYKNIDLSETFGMYSLFDLSPFDIPEGIDEKQQNFNKLIELLQSENENALADKLVKRHEAVRGELTAVYKALPRCVFQGDENFSNLLVDENGHFAGFIDFNLAGTEVIVNQLANLASPDYEESGKEPIGARMRLDNAVKAYRENMAQMLEHYEASEAEKRAAALYAWIVFIAQWPIFCYFRWAMKGELRSEILELLDLIADLPEERLMPR